VLKGTLKSSTEPVESSTVTTADPSRSTSDLSWFHEFFRLGDKFETPSEASSRRLMAASSVVPALIALAAVMASNGPTEIAGVPEAFAGLMVALVTGGLLESLGRACVVLVLTPVLLLLLHFALAVPGYSSQTGSIVSTVAVSLGALVVVGHDIRKYHI
jgi:hypothetical protein